MQLSWLELGHPWANKMSCPPPSPVLSLFARALGGLCLWPVGQAQWVTCWASTVCLLSLQDGALATQHAGWTQGREAMGLRACLQALVGPGASEPGPCPSLGCPLPWI